MGQGSDEAFRDLLGLQEEICRLFDEQSVRVQGGRESNRAQWMPSVDIYENGDCFVLVAEVPGVAQEEIRLEIADDLLVLRGERPSSTGEASHSYHRIERPNGIFQRTFRLPVLVDALGVSASCRDGVLRIVLPKKGAAGGKKITVEVHAGGLVCGSS